MRPSRLTRLAFQIGAILHLGQPSVTVLGAAELLFGKVSPAGRTIQTVYPTAYQDEISIFDFNMRPGPSTFARPDCFDSTNPAACPRGTNPGRTHRFYTGTSVVPFGFGLSYTTWSYSVTAVSNGGQPIPPETSEDSTLSVQPIRLGAVQTLLEATAAAGRTFPASDILKASVAVVQYSVNVTNTGTVDADDVVLGFIKPPGSGTNGVPIQSLFGFERVHVRQLSSPEFLSMIHTCAQSVCAFVLCFE
jgi:hypothetical protein